jgi:adenosylhomocysteine nucleosidase
MKFGIIGPSKEEILPLVDLMEHRQLVNHAMLDFHVGEYRRIPVVAVFSGVGKVNAAIAAQSLIDMFKVTHIILTGVAGALKDGLRIGDIIIATEIVYHDVAPEILTEYHPWIPSAYFKPHPKLVDMCVTLLQNRHMENRWHTGRIITGESFIKAEARAALIAKFQPYCVDMESAAIAHVCYVNSIPYLVIRAISDNADEHGAETFEQNVETSSLLAIDIVKELIVECSGQEIQ